VLAALFVNVDADIARSGVIGLVAEVGTVALGAAIMSVDLRIRVDLIAVFGILHGINSAWPLRSTGSLIVLLSTLVEISLGVVRARLLLVELILGVVRARFLLVELILGVVRARFFPVEIILGVVRARFLLLVELILGVIRARFFAVELSLGVVRASLASGLRDMAVRLLLVDLDIGSSVLRSLGLSHGFSDGPSNGLGLRPSNGLGLRHGPSSGLGLRNGPSSGLSNGLGLRLGLHTSGSNGLLTFGCSGTGRLDESGNSGGVMVNGSILNGCNDVGNAVAIKNFFEEAVKLGV